MADVVELTSLQRGTLHAIAAMRGVGHEEAELDGRALRALERRKLVETRGSRTCSRRLRWFATLAGFDRVKADGVGASAQPLRQIVPSKRSLWEGAPAQNPPFTGGQILELDRRRLNPDTVRRIVVKVPVPGSELYVPAGEERPTRGYCCPVVGTCRKPPFTGRATVLTPSGDLANRKWDGSDPKTFAAWRPVAPYGRENWL